MFRVFSEWLALRHQSFPFSLPAFVIFPSMLWFLIFNNAVKWQESRFIYLEFLAQLPFPFIPSVFFSILLEKLSIHLGWLPEDDSLIFGNIFCIAFVFQGFPWVQANGLPFPSALWRFSSCPFGFHCFWEKLSEISTTALLKSNYFFLSISQQFLFDFQHLYIHVLRHCCLESVVWNLST